MKQFVSHIDFLIQKHDCVIIPDFGGFVLSHEFASVATNGVIYPPRVEVGFNPDLRYNDGLLAESYMNAYSISYDVACKKITDIVGRINTILSLRQSIQMGSLGCLCLDVEGKLCFTPNPDLNLSYAANYGLSILNISRLVDIVENPLTVKGKPNKRIVPFQRIFTGIGAAAAAILIFFVTSTPVLDDSNLNAQKAGFFTDLLNVSSTNISPNVESLISNQKNQEIETEEVVEKSSPVKIEIVVEDTKSVPKIIEAKKNTYPMYYVVVSSIVGKTDAQVMLEKVKNQGYKNADMIVAPERTRIYVGAFENKSQAEKYLSEVKSSNPKFNDAWVYTKRR